MKNTLMTRAFIRGNHSRRFTHIQGGRALAVILLFLCLSIAIATTVLLSVDVLLNVLLYR